MDANEKAFEYAGETVRQLLTLATGVIALTVTFADDVIQPGSGALPWMKWAWALFGVSIFCGILTLMSMAGNLHQASVKSTIPSAFSPNIVIFGNLQIWIAFVALILTIRFGVVALNEVQMRPKAAATPTRTMPSAGATAN